MRRETDRWQVDADFDGLADGQELYVKSVKTPKRYPIPDRTGTADGSAWTPSLDLGLTAPATMLTSAVAMVGLTHPYVGQLAVDLHRVSASANTTFGLRSTDLLDGAAIALAFKTLPSLAKAKGPLSRAYPLMFPVGEILGLVSQVSAAATLIGDVAVLGDVSGLW